MGENPPESAEFLTDVVFIGQSAGDPGVKGAAVMLSQAMRGDFYRSLGGLELCCQRGVGEQARGVSRREGSREGSVLEA